MRWTVLAPLVALGLLSVGAAAAPSGPKPSQLRFDVSMTSTGAWEQHSGKSGDVCVGWDDRTGRQKASFSGSGKILLVAGAPVTLLKGKGQITRSLKVNTQANEFLWNPVCGCEPTVAADLPNGVKRSHDPPRCDKEPPVPLPVIAKCGKAPMSTSTLTYDPNSGEVTVMWGATNKFRNCEPPSGPPLLPVRIRLDSNDMPAVGQSRKVIKFNPPFKPVTMERDGHARVTALEWSLSLKITRTCFPC